MKSSDEWSVARDPAASQEAAVTSLGWFDPYQQDFPKSPHVLRRADSVVEGQVQSRYRDARQQWACAWAWAWTKEEFEVAERTFANQALMELRAQTTEARMRELRMAGKRITPGKGALGRSSLGSQGARLRTMLCRQSVMVGRKGQWLMSLS